MYICISIYLSIHLFTYQTAPILIRVLVLTYSFLYPITCLSQQSYLVAGPESTLGHQDQGARQPDMKGQKNHATRCRHARIHSEHRHPN